MERKLFLSTMAVVVATSGTAPVHAQTPVTFTDVSKDSVHYGAIHELAQRGVVYGFKDGTFRAETPVTRGQAAKMIVEAFNISNRNDATIMFDDVEATSVYKDAIHTLAQLNVIQGYSDKTFRPNDPVTRNHIAVMLTRLLKLTHSTTVNVPFTDVDKMYEQAIATLYAYRIVSGTTATTYGGNLHVTRGQLASFIVRSEKVLRENHFAQTILIERIEGQRLVANGKQYMIAKPLQHVLNSENSEALQGAAVQVLTKGNEIVEVTHLQLNAAGRQGKPVVLDGKSFILNGDVTINADFVEIQHLTVKGDMFVTEHVLSSFSAKELVVEKDVQVAQVRTSSTASLHLLADTLPILRMQLTNSALPSIYINRANTQVASNQVLKTVQLVENVRQVELNAHVEKVIVGADISSRMTILGNGTIHTLNVLQRTNSFTLTERPFIDLQWNGTIQQLVHSEPTVNMQLSSQAFITKLILSHNINHQSLFTNWYAASGRISAIQLADGTIVTPTFSSGGGGGSKKPSTTTPDTALIEAKTAAKVILEQYVNASAYTKNTQTLTDAIAIGKAAIDAATDVAGVDAAIANAKAVIDGIESDAVIAQKLANAKTAAKSELDNYVDEADYTLNNVALTDAIAIGKTAIEAATDDAGVDTALANAKAVIDGIESDAVIAQKLANAKTAAKSELDNYVVGYVNNADYTLSVDMIANIVSSGKTAIEAAIDVASVETALEEAKELIDQIETDEVVAQNLEAKQSLVHFNFEDNVVNKATNVAATVENSSNLSYELRGSNKAITFGGVFSPSQVNVTADTSFIFTDEITISYFLKLNSTLGMDGYGSTVYYGIHDVLADTGDWDINHRIFTSKDNGNSIVMYYTKPAQSEEFGRLKINAIPVNTWVHVAFVFSKTTATSYINGVVSESFTISPSDFSILNEGFSIGKSGSWYPLDGSLDDFRIYNSPLSSAEIKLLSGK